eukprot:scaffold1610_cov257-Pinguiococcus_pyrenoidosus.AAC.48
MSFKCTACAVMLDASQDVRAHYRSEWHKYNLKRKSADLAPIAESLFLKRQEDFIRRGQATHAAAVPTKAKKRQRKPRGPTKAGAASREVLTLAGKDYRDSGAVLNSRLPVSVRLLGTCVEIPLADDDVEEAADLHSGENSPSRAVADARKGHGEAKLPTAAAPEESKIGQTAPVETATDAEDVVPVENEEVMEVSEPEPCLDANVCMFCNEVHEDVDACLEHMRVEHGFFLPEEAYLVDRLGLLRYLHEKVKLGRMCLYCNGYGKRERSNGMCKVFASARAVQAHMRDKGHCMLCYEEGIDLHEYEPFYDFTKSYISAPGVIGHQLENGDDEVDLSAFQLYENDFGELVLPSGRVVGHRERQAARAINPLPVSSSRWQTDFRRYYDQRGRHAEALRKPAFLAVEAERQSAGGMQLSADVKQWQLRKATGYGSGGGSASLVGNKEAAREVRRAKRWAHRQALLQGIKNNQTSRMHLKMYTTVRSFST